MSKKISVSKAIREGLHEEMLRDDKMFKVEHVKMYSDKLCTVEVHFDTALTKQITNEYVGTVRWVMVHNGFTWYATSLKLLNETQSA